MAGWVRVDPFGRVWRPYASYGWRPFTYGHWIYTRYGPYWEGYEPWAWAGYHYGHWIFARRYGWVWVPGYEWHPGRVVWARGYGTIGWMPMPPDGYDYRDGYLRFYGRNNQFSYYDDDFGEDFSSGSYSYGGPYYDPRARDMYYNPSYASININLWVFIDGAHFGTDNYADYDLGSDYTRYAFDQRTVRISNRPMEMGVLERIIRQPIQQVPVDVRDLRTDKQNIRVVVPSGRASVERIRRQSPEVVQQVIAPAFAEEQKQFKGRNSKIQGSVSRIFNQENVPPRVETRSSDQVIDQAREIQKNREQKRIQNMEKAKQRTEQLKKEGRIGEPGKDAGRAPMDSGDQHPTIGGEQPQQKARPEGQQDQKQKLEEQELEQRKQIQRDQQQKREQQELEQQKQIQRDQQQKREQQELEQQKQIQRDQQQKLEQERLKQQRLEERRLEQQKLEQQKLERQKLEQQKLEQERLKQQRLEERRLEQERLKQQRLEERRLEQERLKQQRLEERRLEQQKLEQQKLERQKLEQQKLEQERLEQQELEQQKQIQSDQQPEL
jgi:hypothetical protein